MTCLIGNREAEGIETSCRQRLNRKKNNTERLTKGKTRRKVYEERRNNTLGSDCEIGETKRELNSPMAAESTKWVTDGGTFCEGEKREGAGVVRLLRKGGQKLGAPAKGGSDQVATLGGGPRTELYTASIRVRREREEESCCVSTKGRGISLIKGSGEGYSPGKKKKNPSREGLGLENVGRLS